MWRRRRRLLTEEERQQIARKKQRIEKRKEDRKANYHAKIDTLFSLDRYDTILLVKVPQTFVSNTLHALRENIKASGFAKMLYLRGGMLKSYLMQKGPPLSKIVKHLRGETVLIFTYWHNMDSIKERIKAAQVKRYPRVGERLRHALAVPQGRTSMHASVSYRFRDLNLPTEFKRGEIWFTHERIVCQANEIVTGQIVDLYRAMKYQPVTMSLTIDKIYNKGDVFSAGIEELDDYEILERAKRGIRNVAALCQAIHYPTSASVLPHSIVNAFVDIQAIALALDYPLEMNHAAAAEYKNSTSKNRPVMYYY